LEDAGIEFAVVGHSNRYGPQDANGHRRRVDPYCYIDLDDDVTNEYRDRALQVITDH